MLALAKFLPLPSIFTWVVVGTTRLPGAGTIGALIVIVGVLSGVFMVGALKTRADETQRLLSLAREEAAIERDARARLEKENAILSAQPNLDEHARLLRSASALIEKLVGIVTRHDEHTQDVDKEMVGLLRELRDGQDVIVRAVVPPT